MSLIKRLTYSILLILTSLSLSAQNNSEQKDSLIRLMSAQSAELIEKDGITYRKITGPARFLHNDTYLICDTALQNVNLNIIKAIGNVKILQDQTVLSGDYLDYFVDQDLAQFRGTLVQLEDKDHNMLRTRFLDYNTKDSVAVFKQGGSMKDKSGQIIESRNGTYDSKIKTFTFTDDVNMFTDSTFIKTNRLIYDTSEEMATFTTPTDAWNQDKMLSSGGGWYDRRREIFFFRNNVHVMSKEQEGWSDSLYFYRNTNDLDVRGHVQIIDTTRNVAALAGKIVYVDSVSTVTMTRMPAVMMRQVSQEKVDTTWVGADTLIYRTVMMCDIAPSEISISKERLSDMSSDPVTSYRRQAAEAAAKAAEEAKEDEALAKANGMSVDAVREMSAAEKAALRSQTEARDQANSESQSNNEPVRGEQGDPDSSEKESVEEEQASSRRNPAMMGGPRNAKGVDPSEQRDSSGIPQVDSLSADRMFPSDSLVSGLDSLSMGEIAIEEPKDTTKIGFVSGMGRVRIFREDLQVACDSIAYNDLDSLARFYKSPVIWNEANRQYTADSIAVSIKNQSVDKARLMSNAFIVIEEDSQIFDQIRSAEMMAYFDSTAALSRFDALGGANALFYLEENDVYATVNKVETKMLSARFDGGSIDRVYYFESSRNDAYPTVQLPKAEKELKGFIWTPEKRPTGPQDVTNLSMRPTQRSNYEARPRPSFKNTDIYYPGYMKDVQKLIARGDSLRKVRSTEPLQEEISPVDTLTDMAPFISEDLLMDENQNPVAEDIAPVVSPDSDKTESDMQETVLAEDSKVEPVVSEKEMKKQKKAQERAAKVAARESRWAELNARDAAKAAAKEEKAKAKKRAKTLRMLQKMDKTAEQDQKTIEKYQRKYEKKKARQNPDKTLEEQSSVENLLDPDEAE